MSTLYHVYYRVRGQDGEFLAGPYTWAEMEYQRHDIAGFEGVYDVRCVPACGDLDQQESRE